MKFALVHKNEPRVHSVVNTKAECFEVHEDLTWYPCADFVDIDYLYIGNQFVYQEPPKTNYTVARKVGYGDVGAQLDSIFHSVNAGEDALTEWAARIEKVKILFPKDNQDAVNAANTEVIRRQEIYMDEKMSSGEPILKTAADFTLEVAEDYIAGTWVNPVSGAYIA
jgi:hypothetical protein